VGERADLRPLAIATGGAGLTTMLEDARQRGADTYVTDEGSMSTKLTRVSAGSTSSSVRSGPRRRWA
jgi:hypothetical protein